MTFTTNFDRFVCENDSIDCTIGDTTYTATVVRDPDYKIDDDDSCTI